MKYIKVLGLAVVAAMAVTAFVGAGTASAEKIRVCVAVANHNEGDGKCPTTTTEKEVANGGSVTGTSTNATLTSSITTVTCENSSTTVKLNENTKAVITGEVTALSFTGNCKTSSGTACTVTVVNLPYETATLTTSTLTVEDAVGAGATVKCGFLINCTFTTKKAVLSVNYDKFIASKVELERSGGFCPETAEWHATYTAPVTIETVA